MSQISIGSGELANLVASTQSRGGGGGGGPGPDPIKIMEKQLELEMRRDLVNDKKMAEQSAKDEDRATRMVMLQQAMAERTMQQEAQMRRDLIEAEAASINTTNKDQIKYAADMARALASEQDAAKEAAQAKINENAQKKTAAAKRLTKMQMDHAASTGVVMQTLEQAHSELAKAGATRAAVVRQTGGSLIRAVTATLAGDGEEDVTLREASKNPAMAQRGLPDLTITFGSNSPPSIKDVKGVGTTINALRDGMAALSGEWTNVERDKATNLLSEMMRSARDGDADSFTTSRQELAKLAGPAGMAVVSTWMDEFNLQATRISADAEKPEAGKKMRKSASYKTLEAFRGMMSTGAGQSIYEGINLQEGHDQFFYGLQVAATRPDMTPQERDILMRKSIDSFVKQAAVAYGIKDETKLAQLRGLYGAAANQMLPLDMQATTIREGIMDAQLEQELGSVDVMMGTPAKRFTDALIKITRDDLAGGPNVEPTGLEQAPAGSPGALSPDAGDGGAPV